MGVVNDVIISEATIIHVCMLVDVQLSGGGGGGGGGGGVITGAGRKFSYNS